MPSNPADDSRGLYSRQPARFVVAIRFRLHPRKVIPWTLLAQISIQIGNESTYPVDSTRLN